MSELYLVHHGILGQKWGVRRYQNPDGTLTDAGKKRYGKELIKAANNKKNSYVEKGEHQPNNKVIEGDPYLQSYKRKVVNSEEYRKIQDKADEARTRLKDHYAEYDEYYDTYALAAYLKNPYMNNSSMTELCENMEGWNYYKYDDWNQGTDSSEMMYATTEGLVDEITKDKDAIYEEEKYLRDKGREFCAEVLGSDNMHDSTYNKNGENARMFVRTYMQKHLNDDYEFLDVDKNYGSTDKHVKENGKLVNTASTITKIVDTNSDSGWAALNEAVKALNLGSKAPTDLTNSDWIKIDEYITDKRKNEYKNQSFVILDESNYDFFKGNKDYTIVVPGKGPKYAVRNSRY